MCISLKHGLCPWAGFQKTQYQLSRWILRLVVGSKDVEKSRLRSLLGKTAEAVFIDMSNAKMRFFPGHFVDRSSKGSNPIRTMGFVCGADKNNSQQHQKQPQIIHNSSSSSSFKNLAGRRFVHRDSSVWSLVMNSIFIRVSFQSPND